MKFILGKKINMTQVFDKNSVATAATVLDVTPVVVTYIKSKERDGYVAVQLGAAGRRANLVNKPVTGHLKDNAAYSTLREFRVDSTDLKVGDKIDSSIFKEGDLITVSATSKGKGFQGVVKRHGFGGGPRSHGQKHSEREAGSIGGGLRNKVPKKMRMAGRMGGDRITVANLKILHIDSAANLMYVAGAIPGHRGTLVEIIAK